MTGFIENKFIPGRKSLIFIYQETEGVKMKIPDGFDDAPGLVGDAVACC
jgi:hypothetical protein